MELDSLGGTEAATGRFPPDSVYSHKDIEVRFTGDKLPVSVNLSVYGLLYVSVL